MFDNKKAQLGGLFKYWQYIVFAIVSCFGILIIFKYIFQVAFVGYIYPTFVTTVTNSPIDPTTKAFILTQYANIPLYITICIFSVLMIVLIYLVVLAFREETENVYR